MLRPQRVVGQAGVLFRSVVGQAGVLFKSVVDLAGVLTKNTLVRSGARARCQIGTLRLAGVVWPESWPSLGKPLAQPLDLGIPLGDSPGDQRQGMLGHPGVITEQRRWRPVLSNVRPGPEVSRGGRIRPLARELTTAAHRDHDHTAQDDGGGEDDCNEHIAMVPWPAAW